MDDTQFTNDVVDNEKELDALIGPQAFGHPKGLFYLFFAELWERFSFYGMRALLVLYMTKELLFDDTMSYGIYAAYGSLVYATPLIGGYIADKLIGYRKSIMLGGILMALGHFVLSIEHPVFFYGSLALLIVGNGLFKPNISSMVGGLYKEGDNRRDAGFTIFYMGINLGAFIAPLICGYLGEEFGWHYGFGLAGIGMLVGLIFFYRGTKDNVFGDIGLPPSQELYEKKTLGLNMGNMITVLSFIAVPIFAIIVWQYEYESYLVYLLSAVILGVVIYIMTTVSAVERGRLIVIVYFTILASLFWAIFEQAGSSLTTFADRNVELSLLSASQTNSINPGFIILLAIPFSWMWTKLSAARKNPSSPVKFGIGLALLGLGFLIFALSAQSADSNALTPMSYLVIGYGVLTIGELFLSPIGLSKVSELSPAKFVSFLLGVWFLSSFYGHFFAGGIAKLTSSEKGSENIFASGFFGDIVESVTGMTQSGAEAAGDSFSQLYSYVSVYASFGVITIAVGLFAILISPIMKKLMHGIR
ncbi:peptide MFS transporter [Nonlabens spongiae]|nr:peptide MFS transporter [Nonlabens spongiae]